MTSTQPTLDPFGARDTFDSGSGKAGIYRLSRLEDAGLTAVETLPFSIRVLLESALRNCDGQQITEEDVKRLAAWGSAGAARAEILKDPELELPPEPEEAPGVPLAVGTRVRWRALGIVGEVLALPGDDEAELAVSGKRVRVPRSELVVPIWHNKEVIGEIDIDSNTPSAFSPYDEQMAECLAELIAPNVKEYCDKLLQS